MRAVIQRVKSASVTIDDNVHASIENGLLILLGIGDSDNSEDIAWLSNKIMQMRIFSDENGLMNKNVSDIQGEILVISQFTLFASTKKGNRPSFIQSAKLDIAIPLYDNFLSALNNLSLKKINAGIFGADMQVALINDGPVTIIIDTKMKE